MAPSPALAAAVQVRCACCRGVLAVAPGMTEFICPKCRMAQRLPPELMPPSLPKASPTPPPPPAPAPAPAPACRCSGPRAQGVDPTNIQLPCTRCKAILNVPHGLARFRCPQCDVDLAVDISKLRHFLASASPGFVPPTPPPPLSLPHMPFLPMMPHLPVSMAPPMVPPAELPEEINENAQSEGHLDSGIVDIKAKRVEMKESPKTVHVDSLSGASTVLFTFTFDCGVTWESANATLDERQKDGACSSNDGFYESRREWMGRSHFMLAFEGSTEGMYRVIRPAVGEVSREMPLVELKSKYKKASSIDKIGKGWQEEYDASSMQIHKRVRVVRLETTNDNQGIVGLIIPNTAVESVLEGLHWVQDIDE